jgi:hypothetical protein
MLTVLGAALLSLLGGCGGSDGSSSRRGGGPACNPDPDRDGDRRQQSFPHADDDGPCDAMTDPADFTRM